MSSWRVRGAVPADLEQLGELLDLFTADHPAARHPRPRAVLHEAMFGPAPLLRVVVAALPDRLLGYAGWRPAFDAFWAMRGATADGLFVRPEARGRGVAVALLAQVCADVRASGGVYLHATYGAAVAPFYEQVVTGWDVRETYLSETSFARLADLAGRPVRELVRALPRRAPVT